MERRRDAPWRVDYRNCFRGRNTWIPPSPVRSGKARARVGLTPPAEGTSKPRDGVSGVGAAGGDQAKCKYHCYRKETRAMRHRNCSFISLDSSKVYCSSSAPHSHNRTVNRNLEMGFPFWELPRVEVVLRRVLQHYSMPLRGCP